MLNSASLDKLQSACKSSEVHIQKYLKFVSLWAKRGSVDLGKVYFTPSGFEITVYKGSSRVYLKQLHSTNGDYWDIISTITECYRQKHSCSCCRRAMRFLWISRLLKKNAAKSYPGQLTWEDYLSFSWSCIWEVWMSGSSCSRQISGIYWRY